MFERFNDGARRVVVFSQEEARDMGHNYVGTEHLLLALIRESEGIASRVLTVFDVGLPFTRAYIQERVSRGEGSPDGHLPFNPRCKKVFENALREALNLGHNWIGTEHLLLGLIHDWDLDDPAIAVLETDYEINRTLLRQEVARPLPLGYEESSVKPILACGPASAIGLVDVSASALPADDINIGQLEDKLSRLVSSWTATYEGDSVTVSVADDSPIEFWQDPSDRRCASYTEALEQVVKEVERAQRLEAISTVLLPARALCAADSVIVDGRPAVNTMVHVLLDQLIESVLTEAHTLGYHGFDQPESTESAT